jgi:hypothetical protein
VLQHHLHEAPQNASYRHPRPSCPSCFSRLPPAVKFVVANLCADQKSARTLGAVTVRRQFQGNDVTIYSRSTSSQSRGRAKRYARTRTPRPSKKPSLQTYRTRNLHHANVFVDTLPDFPPLVDDAVRHILGVGSWDEQPIAPEHHLYTMAAWYQVESQRNTRDVSIEGDWKCSLYSLLRSLLDSIGSDLKAHSSDKGRFAV